MKTPIFSQTKPITSENAHTNPDYFLAWEPGNISDKVSVFEKNGPLAPSPVLLNYVEDKLPTRFNVPALLSFSRNGFNLNAVKSALKILFTYHDGTRVQLNVLNNKYVLQHIVSLKQTLLVEEYDFSQLNYNEGCTRMRAIDDHLQDSFKLDGESRLYRLAYFKLNDEDPHRLLILFHHYICDGISSMKFIADFHRVYEAIKSNQVIYFPKKKSSLIDWNNRLYRFASNEAIRQIPYWNKKIDSAKKIIFVKNKKINNPIKKSTENFKNLYEIEKNSYKKSQVIIDKNSTYKLINLSVKNESALVYLSIYVLIKSFNKLTESNMLWINMINSCRYNVFDDIEALDIFGLIIADSSVLFELSNNLDIKRQLQQIKSQYNDASHASIGLMALKYLNRDLSQNPRCQSEIFVPKIRLNYIPDLADKATKATGVTFANEKTCIPQKEEPTSSGLDVYIDISINSGKLIWNMVSYCDAISHSEFDELASDIQALLLNLVN